MRPAGPTFWLLDERTGWRTAHAEGVVADAHHGLRLAADPGGPASLTAEDGSLGGLVLPARVAVDGSRRCFLLSPAPPFLRRYDPGAGAFLPLPATGGAGSGAREMTRPVAISAAGRRLYVADPGARRVAVFETGSLALLGMWGPRDAHGRRLRVGAHEGWDPVSVAANDEAAVVLDARFGTVHRHRSLVGPPEIILPRAAGSWARVVIDEAGLLYLLDADTDRLAVLNPDGSLVRWVGDPGEVADRFDPPVADSDHRGRIRVADALLRHCPTPPAAPAAGPPPDGPPPGGTWFDPSTGRPATPGDDEWIGPPRFRRHGVWIAGPLDSAIYRCQWHRIQLELTALPPGSRLQISTTTVGETTTVDAMRALPADLWASVPDLVGPAAPTQRSARGDAAVFSREGRYLWLRFEFTGDGYGTPTVEAVRVHYPRMSHLDLLPAVYKADDTARRFLERFLSVMQTQLEGVEHTIRDMPALVDPAAAPPGMIDALSRWLGLPVEQEWDAEQRRTLLRAVPGLLRRRGTPAALRAYLQAYLRNLTGADLGEELGPHVLEGYRERHHFWLTGHQPVGARDRLWSRRVVGRLQLDRDAVAGRSRLVGTGDPDRDVFHTYAHRFRVVVPAPWVRTAADERKLRRAIEAEKPAHTAYQLALVHPGIVIGRQATVGVDTVVGAVPRLRLACPHDHDAAPSRPPRGRLGVDSVLAGEPTAASTSRVPSRTGPAVLQ